MVCHIVRVDTKHLQENDHVFKSDKFCKRFPDFKITTPQEAAAEIVLIEGTHMTLQAEGKAFHEKKVTCTSFLILSDHIVSLDSLDSLDFHHNLL